MLASCFTQDTQLIFNIATFKYLEGQPKGGLGVGIFELVIELTQG